MAAMARLYGDEEVTVLDRLFAAIARLRRPDIGPVPPPPRIRMTTADEKRRIDDRLRGAEAHLAELTALAGLDELRGRQHGQHDAV